MLISNELIRAAGCHIHYIEGLDPSDDPDSFLSDILMDAVAAHYSKNLSKNIRRGVNYNAANALTNSHKIFSFMIGADKHYAAAPVPQPGRHTIPRRPQG